MNMSCKRCKSDANDLEQGEASIDCQVRNWLVRKPELLHKYDQFCIELQRKKMQSAYEVAKKTYKLVMEILDFDSLDNFNVFSSKLRKFGFCLLQKQPMALTITSVVLRFISIVRQESYAVYAEEKRSSVPKELDASLSSVILAHLDDENLFETVNDKEDLKVRIRETAAEEIGMDIENASAVICAQSHLHVNQNEVILTYSESYAVRDFLVAANQKKMIDVICCETFPSLIGQQFALDLCKNHVNTTVIHDAAAFTVMSRCNKVVLGCHAVLANGGVLVPSGGSNLVMAAAHFKVPVVVLTAMYKLCPIFCSDQHTINDMASPNQVIPYCICDETLREVDVINPTYDYIPPELITLILTPKGGFPPSFIFRLMKECYLSEDMTEPLHLRYSQK